MSKFTRIIFRLFIIYFILISAFVFDTLINGKFKYWLILLGILFIFWAEHIEKEKHKRYWLSMRYLGLLALIGGILVTFQEDRESDLKSARLFKKMEQQSEEQRYLFDNNIKKLEGVASNITNFQKRQQNPMPDSLFLTFTIVFDISKSPLRESIIRSNVGYNTIDLYGESASVIPKKTLLDSSSKNDIKAIEEYLSTISNELLVRFSKDGDTITYKLDFSGYDPSYEGNKFYAYGPEKIKCVLAYDQNHYTENREFLKLTKFVPGSFISILDFKNSDVQIIFGRPVYDPVKFIIPSQSIKVLLENVSVRFNAIADYAKIGNLRQSKKNHLEFKGSVTEFRLKSKSSNTSWDK